MFIDIDNINSLARAAESFLPSTEEAGAFLLEIAEEASDWHGDDDIDDVAHHIADGAVYRLESRGTFGKWHVFVDLGAYCEDVSLFSQTSMDKQADVALYQIAQRLAYAILSKREAVEA